MKQTPNHSQHGFTLIEIIGVLAIMSIMAATIAPSAIQMLTAGKQTSEDKALAGISDALRLFVQTNKQVPAATAALPIAAGATNAANVVAWDKAIGTVMNVPSTKVSTNIINKKRIYLYPADFIAASTPTPPLPYDQTQEVTNLNTAAPNNGKLITTKPDPRIMVISNMNPGVTLATASGSLTKANFDAIWKQSNIPNTYTELTEGDKLKIARINMRNIFLLKTFTSGPSVDTYAAIQVGGVPTTPYGWTGTASKPFYLITGSLLTLAYTTDIINGPFTIYSKSVVSNQQPNFYFSGSASPAWSSAQIPISQPSNPTLNPPSNITSAFNLIADPYGNSGISANAWKKSSTCTDTGTLTLSVENQNKQYDYYLYNGDPSTGVVLMPKAASKYTNKYNTCGSVANDSRIKSQEGCNFSIPACTLIIMTPDAKKIKTGSSPNIYMFYMTNQTVTPVVLK